jgi:hypothetical protein
MPAICAPAASCRTSATMARPSVFRWPLRALNMGVLAGCMLAGLGAAVAAGQTPAQPQEWKLGGHFPDELPPLSAEEMSAPRMQALWLALAGEPYAHRAEEHARAGCAMLVRPRAIPSETRHYGGYRVGGGVPFRGDPAGPEDGTFGWDYFGLTVPKRVALRWSVPPRWQGGAGQYRTTGARHPGRE